jgi:2-(1,2-epoxy-1,2-dihydrophenyl)acetyl-CoA isomerase
MFIFFFDIVNPKSAKNEGRMKYETILLDKDQGVATVTLNQPEMLNVFSHKMMDEVVEALSDIANDVNVRVAVLTGVGRAFCAGVDIREHFLGPIEQRKRGKLNIALQDFFSKKGVPAIMNLGKPIIAAINGPAVGLGCTVCLACDLRIASEKAQLSFGFVRVGITPEFGSTYFLPRLIGISRSLELLYTGRMIHAREAKEIGLVNKVVPPDRLAGAAYEMAQTIANAPPIVVKLIREGIYQGVNVDINTALRWEHFAFNTCLSTDDHEEGVKAFLDKRKPLFKGK